MGMQTSKKKLSKIPSTPTDKYFIVTDDSKGPVNLEGQFLTMNKKVVSYPKANNSKQVVEEFGRYVGLGRKEVIEERINNGNQKSRKQL